MINVRIVETTTANHSTTVTQTEETVGTAYGYLFERKFHQAKPFITELSAIKLQLRITIGHRTQVLTFSGSTQEMRYIVTAAILGIGEQFDVAYRALVVCNQLRRRNDYPQRQHCASCSLNTLALVAAGITPKPGIRQLDLNTIVPVIMAGIDQLDMGRAARKLDELSEKADRTALQRFGPIPI